MLKCSKAINKQTINTLIISIKIKTYPSKYMVEHKVVEIKVSQVSFATTGKILLLAAAAFSLFSF